VIWSQWKTQKSVCVIWIARAKRQILK